MTKTRKKTGPKKGDKTSKRKDEIDKENVEKVNFISFISHSLSFLSN